MKKKHNIKFVSLSLLIILTIAGTFIVIAITSDYWDKSYNGHFEEMVVTVSGYETKLKWESDVEGEGGEYKTRYIVYVDINGEAVRVLGDTLTKPVEGDGIAIMYNADTGIAIDLWDMEVHNKCKKFLKPAEIMIYGIIAVVIIAKIYKVVKKIVDRKGLVR